MFLFYGVCERVLTLISSCTSKMITAIWKLP